MLKSFVPQKMLPFIVSLSFFMEAVDTTILNTAIPAISQSLLVDPVDLKIALISYLLSLAIFIPISGWLADRFGAKRIFITALCVFTLGSFGCGLAQNLTHLVIARFIQGLGGALGLPVGRLLIIRAVGRENLISTMNHVVTVGSLGMMLGPVIGGVITHYFSWHWIFWVNIPVGFMAIFLANNGIKDNECQAVPPLDKFGFLLFGMALALFTFGLSALSETTFSSWVSLVIIGCAMVLFVAYQRHSRGIAYPIVKTDLLTLRTFKVSVVGNLISRLGFGGVPFLVPLLLQIGLGYPSEISGFLLAPIAIGVLISKHFYLPLLRRYGYRRLLIINTFLAGCSIWTFMMINASTSLYAIGGITFLYGCIISVQYGLMNSLAYADISTEKLSAATSIMGTIQQIAQSLGVAVSAVLIRYFILLYSEDSTLNPTVFHATFFSVGLITLLSSLVFFQLKPEDGQQMII